AAGRHAVWQMQHREQAREPVEARPRHREDEILDREPEGRNGDEFLRQPAGEEAAGLTRLDLSRRRPSSGRIINAGETVMSVTLYYGSGSAYAWRIWLALEHKSVPYELKLLSFSDGDLKTPEYTVLNPRQRVPTLVHDGLAYRESAAIMEYVEERWPEPPLFARDLRLRAEQRRIVREADNYVADAVEHLFAAVFAPPEKADAVKLAQAVTALKDEIARWEPELKADYLTGDGVSVADYTLYPHLAIIERFCLRRPDAIPADLFPPRMAAWMERMKALPLIRKTWPPHWKS